MAISDNPIILLEKSKEKYFTSVNIYIYLCVCVCVCNIYIYIYIYIYIHIYMILKKCRQMLETMKICISVASKCNVLLEQISVSILSAVDKILRNIGKLNTHTHTHTHTYTHTHTESHTYTQICVFVCLCVSVCLCVYLYEVAVCFSSFKYKLYSVSMCVFIAR